MKVLPVDLPATQKIIANLTLQTREHTSSAGVEVAGLFSSSCIARGVGVTTDANGRCLGVSCSTCRTKCHKQNQYTYHLAISTTLQCTLALNCLFTSFLFLCISIIPLPVSPPLCICMTCDAHLLLLLIILVESLIALLQQQKRMRVHICLTFCWSVCTTRNSMASQLLTIPE